MKKGTRVRIETGREGYSGGYDGRIGIIIQESTSVLTVLLDNGDVVHVYANDLKEVEPSIDSLTPGDVLVDTDGKESKVLAVMGDVFLVSRWDDFDAAHTWCTKSGAKKWSFKIRSRKDDVIGSIVEVVVDGKTYAMEVKGLRK